MLLAGPRPARARSARAAGQVGEALVAGARAPHQPRRRQRPALRVRLRRGRRRAGRAPRRQRRAAEGPAAGRCLLRGADHAHAAARRLPRAAARRVDWAVRSWRAASASSSPTCIRGATSARSRSSSRRSRRSRAGSTWSCRATCAGGTCRATRRSCSSRAARRIARTACSPTCTTSTTCACVCVRPLPLHADGDDLGDVEEIVYGVARDAARILV